MNFEELEKSQVQQWLVAKGAMATNEQKARIDRFRSAMRKARPSLEGLTYEQAVTLISQLEEERSK